MHTEGSPTEMQGLLEHVGVKGGHVACLHAPGLAELEGSRGEVGPYGPLWGGLPRTGQVKAKVDEEEEEEEEEEKECPRGAARAVLQRVGVE